jgi:hypothetical protein
VADHAVRIHQQLTADLHPMLRLPLAALAFPVLRLRPRPQLDAFMDTCRHWSMPTARSRCSNTAWAAC